ncbi:MAG: hypothetical protein H0Z33_03215 [Bacillaceae bacterium]|nr:hypothetical protein [Bacillaceae bacterium]
MSNIKSAILSIHDISEADQNNMYLLLQRYFDGITRENFIRDLREKSRVILLKDTGENAIVGFSNMMVMDFNWKGKIVKIVFSGDTIVDRAYWGSMELPKAWGKLVFSLRETDPGKKWFWFLISSGYKTYRFLPVFFKNFYPCFYKQTPPDIQGLMDDLAAYKYGRDYRKDRGVVRFSHSSERLKEGVAPVTADKLKDPHVQFFIDKNPRHDEGEELVCLCEIHPENLTKAGHRVIGSRVIT